MKRLFILLCTISVILAGCGNMSSINVFAVDTVDSLEEVADGIEAALKEGKTEYTFSSELLGEEELLDINDLVDHYYGSVEYCGTETGVVGPVKVRYQLKISDTAYVEQAILNGKDIPVINKKAMLLKEFCEKTLPEIIDGKETAYQKERAIHDYIVKNTAYGFPKGDESQDSDAYTAYGALLCEKAVCNGYAQAMKLLCTLAEIPCEIVTGTSHGDNHAWNIVQLEDEEWYQVDVTWDDPRPDVPGRVLFNYFNITDDQAALDHTWEKGRFPKANGTTYNFFAINDRICSSSSDFKEKCLHIIEEDRPEKIQLLVQDYNKDTYDNTFFQFLFDTGIVDNVKYQVIGEKPYTTLYLELSYK